MTPFSFVLSQCPQNHNHIISYYLPSSMNSHCPHSTEKYLHNFSLYAFFFPTSAQPLIHSKCFLPTPWALPWALCQTHACVYILPGCPLNRREVGNYRNKLPAIHSLCLHRPVKSASKILQAAQAGWKWERYDLLSADVLQLCTQSVAEANHSHKSFLADIEQHQCR